MVVDTSAFIDYFGSGDEQYIPALALSNSIILSKIVRLELLKGARKSDRKSLLNFFGGLIELDSFAPAELCESLLLRLHGRGLNLGLMDILILADAAQTRSLLLTSDQPLATAAKIIGVKLCL